MKLATASSKPVDFIRQILDEDGLLPLFHYIGGTDFDNKSADKAEIMRGAMRALGVSENETMMVGDRLYDIDGAHRAGLPCIAVLYGFGSREEFEKYGVGAVRKAAREGDAQHGSFLAGQVAAMVNKEQTCKEIIEDLFTQGEQVLGGAMKWVK